MLRLSCCAVPTAVLMMPALRKLVDCALRCLRDRYLRCDCRNCASQASPEGAGLCRRRLRRGSLDGCRGRASLDLPCRRVARMRRMRGLQRVFLLGRRVWAVQSSSSSSCCSAQCVANAVQAEVDGAIERVAHV